MIQLATLLVNAEGVLRRTFGWHDSSRYPVQVLSRCSALVNMNYLQLCRCIHRLLPLMSPNLRRGNVQWRNVSVARACADVRVCACRSCTRCRTRRRWRRSGPRAATRASCRRARSCCATACRLRTARPSSSQSTASSARRTCASRSTRSVFVTPYSRSRRWVFVVRVLLVFLLVLMYSLWIRASGCWRVLRRRLLHTSHLLYLLVLQNCCDGESLLF